MVEALFHRIFSRPDKETTHKIGEENNNGISFIGIIILFVFILTVNWFRTPSKPPEKATAAAQNISEQSGYDWTSIFSNIFAFMVIAVPIILLIWAAFIIIRA